MRLSLYPLRLIIALSLLIVSACGETPTELQLAQHAVAIERGDECHLCGMIINGFPGPKGELYKRGNDQTMKFCSTRDMFSYLLDPEHKHAIQTVYVHDMAISLWDTPDDEFFIDARSAWYVAGHERNGAMGPTLASFSNEDVATTFAGQYGGDVYQFKDINQELLLQIK